VRHFELYHTKSYEIKEIRNLDIWKLSGILQQDMIKLIKALRHIGMRSEDAYPNGGMWTNWKFHSGQ
jgi:hypothetical protein